VTGPPSALPLTLNNPAATQDLLQFLGVKDRTVRFSVIDAILPVAIVSEPDPVDLDRPAIGTAFVSPVAAQFPQVQLFNPPGSGRDIHVDSFVVFSSTAQIFQLRSADTAIATNVADLSFRDRRQPGTPVAQIRRATTVAIAGDFFARGVLDAVNAEIIYPVDFILGEGQGVIVFGVLVNTELSLTYYWEEMPQS